MSKPLALGVLVSGRGSNLGAIIEAIEAQSLAAEIRLVISDKPQAKALDRAAEAKIATEVIERKDYGSQGDFEKALVEALQKAEVELVVLAGFMRLVGTDFLKHFPERVINIHPSLLPSFPGLDAQKQALDYGVKISGCTVHIVTEIMDGGPILAQTAVEVAQGDTEESLSARILAAEHRLLPQVIGRLAAKK